LEEIAHGKVLKLLSRNKSESTLMLLDTDTKSNKSKENVTQKSLEDIGFNSVFLENNVKFIGLKEFEDAFSNTLICKMSK